MESTGVHPLLIPLVINKIISPLDLDELKKVRLVCSAWKAEAEYYVGRLTRINFPTEDLFKEFVLGRMDAVENIDFLCREVVFKDDFDLGEKSMMFFMTKFGSGIESLSLINVRWKTDQLETILVGCLPKLKALKLVGPIPRKQPLFFENRFVSFPNLTMLHLNLFDKTRDVTKVEELLKNLFVAIPNLEVLSTKTDTHENFQFYRNMVFFRLLFDTLNKGTDLKFVNSTIDVILQKECWHPFEEPSKAEVKEFHRKGFMVKYEEQPVAPPKSLTWGHNPNMPGAKDMPPLPIPPFISFTTCSDLI